MKFALLGIDADSLELAQTIVASGEHELSCACDVAVAEGPLRALAPRLQIVEFWESLLASESAEAVIVSHGANSDERAEQLRKLVQAGVPLILTHPIDDSMLICYELDMIRRETGCVMVPYIANRWHAGVQRLAPSWLAPAKRPRSAWPSRSSWSGRWPIATRRGSCGNSRATSSCCVFWRAS